MNKHSTEIATPVGKAWCFQRVQKLAGKALLLALAALILAGVLQTANAFVLGPAFTYHGRLQSDAVPVSGTYDLTFSLYTNGTGGTAVEGPLTNSAIAVNNGVFTVRLDFGVGVFDGTAYWLEIGVRTNGDGGFTTLSPRHELLATPYAVYAENARAGGLTGTIPAEVLRGTYGSAVNFDFIGSGGPATGPNLIYSNSSGVFIGAGSANQVGPNVKEAVIGGGHSNTIQSPDSVVGGGVSNAVTTLAQFSFIGGGLGNVAEGTSTTVAGGSGNAAAGNSSTVSGGNGNTAGGLFMTVGGGSGNSASGLSGSSVGGGLGNAASGLASTVAGGSGNTAGGIGYSSVGGGSGNTASGSASTVPGGQGNSALGDYSFAAGQFAQATGTGSFVWGDGSQNPFKGVAADDAFSVLASGGVFLYNGANGVHVDGNDKNNGSIDFALRFGAPLSSGEGIASKRTGGGNQFGLDFYTASANRLSIDKFGNVGIGTNKPQAQLEVNGTEVLVDGSGGEEAFLSGTLGNVYVGSLNPTVHDVLFYNFATLTPMHIYCSSITIQGGADLAEPFPIADQGNQIPQGSVVVIDDQNPGQLRVSNRPYDSRVAGVISGANGINPGIQMQQQGLLEGGKNVALTGRVYVQAEAIDGAIRPGDLLTTSIIPGHAMKATDHTRAQGAILGKAMTSLDQGKGMVLVLVTLQ